MIIDVRGGSDADDTRSNLYTQLAVYAYAANQTRKGDLAADRAVSLAAESERKLLRENLANAKAQAVAERGLQGRDDAGSRRRRAPRRRPANLSASRPYSSTGRAADS